MIPFDGNIYSRPAYCLIATLFLPTVYGMKPIVLPTTEHHQSCDCVVRANQIDRWTEDGSDRRAVAFGSKGISEVSYCTLWRDRQDTDLRDVECWQDEELGCVLAASTDADDEGGSIFFDFLQDSLEYWAQSQGCRIGYDT